MLTRRQLLSEGVKASPLVALAAAAPGFVARTALAAQTPPKADKDTVLVVLEMTGGNDGLNTVVPYADDLYHKARPTLRFTKQQVVKVDDHVGLHPGLRPLERLLNQGHVAVVQGVGYPNPDRSHFESMDIWQSADPKRQTKSGWLGRGIGGMKFRAGALPAVHCGTEQLPLAVAGAAIGVPSVHPSRPFDLELGVNPNPYGSAARPAFRVDPVSSSDPGTRARRDLIETLAGLPQGQPGDLRDFVQRSQVQTYANIERLRKILEAETRAGRTPQAGEGANLARDLSLVGQMINADFGTRVFYLSVGGFDTHSDQARPHEQLLQLIATTVAGFFDQLRQGGNADRVLLMTFSEFGRRVRENGSRGTDHGAASCLFVIGPGVKGGAVGGHPKLDDLSDGDLKFHTDFRRVYATLLSGWLGCDARTVLGDVFAPIPLLKQA
jgi:uncharacterized protein (DUF1501 family)